MPAYNSDKYIRRSIESVLSQVYKNIELIIVNDGSIDDTKSIILSYQKIDERIKYFEIENSGSAVARNVGLDNCTGEYIGFVDSDDYVDQNMFNVLIKKAEEYSCDIVSASYEWIFPNKNRLEKTYFPEGYYDKKRLVSTLYPNIFSSVSLKDIVPKTMWTKIFKRSLIEEKQIRFVPELKMSQDLIFSVKCMLNAQSFYYLPDEKLYKYMSNKDSRTNTYLKDSWKVMKSNYNQLKIMSNQYPEYNLESQLPYALLRNAMTALANEGRSGKDTSIGQKINSIKDIVNDNELIEAIGKINDTEFSKTRQLLTKLIINKKTIILYVSSKIYNQNLFNK